ncbi:ATP-binding protein [Usitatibacter palustris]|uniref:SAM domain (Sterile alpha motif) n=1 Tax=Usitatibacter palustris TaxID=2732487 RepID=A0A6M4H4S3_9PROT|nr:adenylate/guanylate cyclase domain-containing protein [Usitatibacter palustris]QJR14641.1 hypothetical protein DSM104440_01451 [Usitatibacter palustris]
MKRDVRTWLETGGFGEYADVFEERGIDAEALPLLTDVHLREMGVPIGPRVKLLAAIVRLATGDTANPERRRLTLMFVDLVGSTPLSSRLDPEELRDLIREYQATIATEAERYAAHVAQYVGDGALVYFGYPRAHEDDAERAVRAALSIVRAVAALRSPSGEPLAAHIGIATGLVVVGDLLAKERAVIGETPNLAARLLEQAGAGEIVVSAQTRSLVGNVFEMREMEPRRLKGLPEPVTAYAVLAERTVATRYEARQGDSVTAMVGRDAELGLLKARWRLALEGRGQMVVLTGEPGIGKSRILRALEDELAGGDHVLISNQCSPYHSGSALHPMIQQLRRASGIGADESVAQQLDRLDAILGGAEDADAALIASLLGIDGSGRYGKLDLSPEQQRARTFETLLTQVLRISERTPVLWVLEDAHWIDPTTLELVEMCVERIAGSRILAIVTARPEFVHHLDERGHLTRLSLGRLGPSDIAAMVGHLAKGHSLPVPVLGEIAAKSDGVPLFVEELTKTVLEAQARQGERGSPGFARLSVPASLHDSMMARLDRHATVKDVAQTAACIGREFDRALLEQVSGLEATALHKGLAGLEEAELVFRRNRAEGDSYVFKHALVRDAAYESLLRSKRQEIHARIVAALEGNPEAPPEILAQHAAEAGLIEKAIACWERAGAQALARPAYQEAIAHLSHALQRAESMPLERTWQECRLRLLLLLGQATIPLRGYSHSETVAVFERAQALIDTMPDRPNRFSVSYAMWVAYYVRGEHAKALRIARGMRDGAQRDRSDGRMLTALRALGIGEMITGELVAANTTFELAEELAIVLRRQSREQRIAVAQRFAADPDIATQFHVALTLLALGYVDRAWQLVEQTVAAARAMGHVHTLGHALVHGAIVAAMARDADAARRFSAEALAFANEHDMDLWRGYGAVLSGHARVLSGDVPGALPLMERGLRHLARTQTGAMVPAHHAVHAYVLAAMGHFEAGAAEAGRVRDELSSGSERYFWPHCLRWLGDYLRLVPGSNSAEVEAAYSEAIALARNQEATFSELCAATSLARLWGEQGERMKAFDLLAPILDRLSEGAGSPAVREASALLQSLQRESEPLAPRVSNPV